MNNTFLEVMALNAEIEGMKAENSMRLSQGYTLAYDEHAFYKVAERIRALKESEPGEHKE